MPAPVALAKRLALYGQDHLLRWWDDLSDGERAELVREIESIDFEQLRSLVRDLVQDGAAVELDPQRVQPVDAVRLPATDSARAGRRILAELGARALRAGEVAVVVVAGGQGTRLGFDGPKGTFPIGPVSGASLFQIHAEKIVALSKRYGRILPLYVMTSPDNHEATIRFFDEHGRFGLEHVRFFVQGQMPAVDKDQGGVLLDSKGRIALTPDGHGGTLTALGRPGANGEPSCLEEMRGLGVRTISYFQVDNPLVQIADPAFLGLHRQSDAEMSFKVVEKVHPDEKLGVVVSVDGQTQVIEYSDLPSELAERRRPEGGLELWAGSIAVHLLEVGFIERILHEEGSRLPFHRAIKRVSHVNDEGDPIEPSEPNAVKFETFIFDALPKARRFALMETSRRHEFEPLKNAEGTESPASVRQRMSDLYAEWLDQAGAKVMGRDSNHHMTFGIEISPLYALDAAELKSKIPPDMAVDQPLYLR